MTKFYAYPNNSTLKFRPRTVGLFSSSTVPRPYRPPDGFFGIPEFQPSPTTGFTAATTFTGSTFRSPRVFTFRRRLPAVVATLRLCGLREGAVVEGRRAGGAEEGRRG